MLPFAYNQLRQAALNYQLNAAAGVTQVQAMEPRPFPTAGPNPYATLGPYAFDPLLGYRPGFGPPRFLHEEPKPQHSYIGLIAMGILSTPDQKMVLSDIYQWILDNYAYFRTRGPGWRNSIRHNLSLNDCFVKAGRSANGKGHYWAVHPANVEDFKKGDFRRRRAQRKVRKHMGLSVADDDEDSDDSCNSPPISTIHKPPMTLGPQLLPPTFVPKPDLGSPPLEHSQLSPSGSSDSSPQPRKRGAFDVESLLAPDSKKIRTSPIPQTKEEKKSPENHPPFTQNGPLPQQFQLSPSGKSGLPANLLWPLGLGLGGLAPFLNPVVSQSINIENHQRSPPSPNAAAQWQETFAKIMARSYQNRQIPTGLIQTQKPNEDTTPPPVSNEI